MKDCYDWMVCESRDCEECEYNENWCLEAAYYTEEDAREGGCKNCINWTPGPDLCRYELPTGDDLTNCH